MNKTPKMQEIEQKFGMDLEELLRQKYEVERKSTVEIGELFGIGDCAIGRWMREYKIPTRTLSEVHLNGKQKPSKKQLRQLYGEEKKNTVEIAEIVGVNGNTVSRWLREYNIPTRNISEIKLDGKQKPTEEQLRQWYEAEKKSALEIGGLVGVSSNTIGRWLRDYKIPIRPNTENQLRGKQKPVEKQLRQLYEIDKKSTNEIGEILGFSSTSIRKWLDNYGIHIRTISEGMLNGKQKPSEEQLTQLYITQRKSTYEIGKMLEVSPKTIFNWMREYKISTRNQDTTRQLKKEALEKVIEKYTT